MEGDQVLFEHYKFVDKGQEPLRVDKFLMNFIENKVKPRFNNPKKMDIFL